jgi:hypothetical protein
MRAAAPSPPNRSPAEGRGANVWLPLPVRERVGVRGGSRSVECRDRTRGVEGARLGVIRDMVIVSRVTLSGMKSDIGGPARGVARRAPLDETREIRIGGRGGALSLAKSDKGAGCHLLWQGLTVVVPPLWSGLLTRPPSPTAGLHRSRETFGQARGTVRRPCHNGVFPTRK